ncbi:MAG: ankyrin repeat domain-containing protein [Treponema sp.]|jgi:ankyrin repeat protein|nr:ankyrin repeat domain-containing protein [Treponema sp.]
MNSKIPALYVMSVFILSFIGCRTPQPKPIDPIPIPIDEPVFPLEDDVWSLIDRGESERVRSFFLGKVDIHAVDERGRSPLHAAAEMENAQLTGFFISQGAEVDAPDKQGRTALCISAEKRDAASAKMLVAAGADIFYEMPGGGSPALTGVVTGGEFLSALLTGDTVQKTNAEGRTILHLAAKEGKADAVDTILQTGKIIGKKDNEGRTALDIAFSYTDSYAHAETAERLILAGGQSSNPFFPYFAPAARSFNYNIRSSEGIAPLHYAAQSGYTGFVSFMLDRNADINIKNAAGAGPLHEAARAGNIPVMDILLFRGADVNAQDAKGNSVLHISIPPEVHLQSLSLLFSYSANPNLKDEHGDSPLHTAVILNKGPEIIRALLEGGADASIRNIEGKTPLYLAVETDRTGNIPLLLSYKADIFAADNKGLTPFEKALRERRPSLNALITPETVLQYDTDGNTILHTAVKNSVPSEIISFILDQGSPVNARNKEGDTSLHLAVRQNEEASGSLLLSRNADIFASNVRGNTPLLLSFFPDGNVSVTKSNTQNIRVWMLTPQTLSARDSVGNTALHYAAQWKLDKDIPLIIERGADTEAVNATGETPLFIAVKSDSASTVFILVTSGAHITSRDILGNTSFHAAVRWNAQKAAEELIRQGIDVNTHALNGKTPLHDAVRLGMREIEEMLMRNRADLEARDAEGNTPFMEALISGLPGPVERLADSGSDIMTRNIRGDTPLHLAVSMNRADMVSLLLGWGASIHARNAQGRTPLQNAFAVSSEMVRSLLTKDRLYSSDDNGSSPLHIAVQEKADPDMLKVIMDQGAKVSAIDREGRTPLRLAVDTEEWELVKVLTLAGADVFSAAGDGKTPAEIALAGGRNSVSALFSGTSINSQDSTGNTILHYAAQIGDTETVSLLLQLGADKNIKNFASERAADIASRYKRSEAAVLLN